MAHVTITYMNRSLVSLFLCACIAGFAGAQAVMPDSVYAEIDAALLVPAQLSSLLSKSSTASWYPRAESYALKKARQLVIEDRLEEAEAVSLAVIDNNLDNSDAVDLYRSIQKTIEKNRKLAEAEAGKQAAEAIRQRVSEAKAKEEVAKSYQSVTNAATGKTIYLDQSFNRHYRSWNWDFSLGLANLGALSEIPGDTGVKYGLGASGGAVWYGETRAIGGEADLVSAFVSLSGVPSMDWTGGAVLFASAPNGHLAFRLGGRMIGLGLGSETVDPVSLPTPVLGIAVRDVPLGDGNRFRWVLDWYPAHLYTAGFLAAGSTALVGSWRMAAMQDFDLILETGFHDTILATDTGIHNVARVSLAIGVGNYE